MIDETKVTTPSPENVVAQLKQVQEDLKNFKVEMILVLTAMLEELGNTKTRTIDFSAWNNISTEYEKSMNGDEQAYEDTDAEYAEGKQE